MYNTQRKNNKQDEQRRDIIDVIFPFSYHPHHKLNGHIYVIQSQGSFNEK